MCALLRGSQHDDMLSGVTLWDRNDRHMFMQNFKSWYLMSWSEQMRICSTSLQMVPHLLRTYSRTYLDASSGVPTTAETLYLDYIKDVR